eukprot:TRINITY_DN11138_c0_g1_i1.p1 TRINITY_DN11138_c0_g1~~TRINITY_DN11138_c0_g1_i1.p1  ORF type:complete len:197 (+),score=58.69 TRINITY_DN11138_c0_g1_i1:66-593(+)
MQGRISGVVNRAARALHELREMADKEQSGKREVMKRSIKALCDEHECVSSGLDKYITGVHKRKVASRQRQQLMEGYVPEDHTSTTLLSEEADSIRKTKKNIANLTSEGAAVLNALRSQTATLQSTSSKLTSYLASMNLSGSIITTITRTERTDKVIIYCGMLIITFMMALIYWYR